MKKETQYPPGKYKLYVDTGFYGASHEDFVQLPEEFGLSESEWDGLSDDEKEQMIDELAGIYLQDNIDYGCHRAED